MQPHANGQDLNVVFVRSAGLCGPLCGLWWVLSPRRATFAS